MKSSLELMAELLPSVRAEIAKELAFSYKLNQSDISRMLGVSQPAVSQYVRHLRGNKRNAFQNSVVDIKALCDKLVNGKLNGSDFENEVYNICKLAAEKFRTA